MSKNYGLLKYTRNHKKPNPAICAKYIEEIFRLTPERITNTLSKIAQRDGRSHVINTQNRAEELARIVKSVFVEKQLLAHDRPRIAGEIDLTDFDTNTLSGICAKILEKYDSEELKNASGKGDKYEEYVAEKNMSRKNKDLQELTRNFNKQVNKISERQQKRQDHIKQTAVSDYEEIKKNSNTVRKNDCPSISAGKAEEYKNTMGDYDNLPLSRTLKKVLDTIIGNTEIRSVERGFNRPSRFSHFVKGCFLPCYKSNKPRKRPAFYIDASGSMESSRGNFTCITSAVAAFLRTQHRRISELRPKYFAFTTHLPYVLNLKHSLPIAHGGTDCGFLANVDPKDNTVVITDAFFNHCDIETIKLWSNDNPTGEIHWVVNNEITANTLKTELSKYKNQHIHYTEF